jgi:hypothetical protein
MIMSAASAVLNFQAGVLLVVFQTLNQPDFALIAEIEWQAKPDSAR